MRINASPTTALVGPFQNIQTYQTIAKSDYTDAQTLILPDGTILAIRFPDASPASLATNVALNKPYSHDIPAHPTYRDIDSLQLTNGSLLEENISGTECSVGWNSVLQGNVVNVIIDLSRIYKLESVRGYFGSGNGIHVPSVVSAALSTDGYTFEIVSTVTNPIDTQGWINHTFTATSARYVRFTIMQGALAPIDSWIMLGELEAYASAAIDVDISSATTAIQVAPIIVAAVPSTASVTASVGQNGLITFTAKVPGTIGNSPLGGTAGGSRLEIQSGYDSLVDSSVKLSSGLRFRHNGTEDLIAHTFVDGVSAASNGKIAVSCDGAILAEFSKNGTILGCSGRTFDLETTSADVVIEHSANTKRALVIRTCRVPGSINNDLGVPAFEIIGDYRNPSQPDYGHYKTIFATGNPGIFTNGAIILNGGVSTSDSVDFMRANNAVHYVMMGIGCDISASATAHCLMIKDNNFGTNFISCYKGLTPSEILCFQVTGIGNVLIGSKAAGTNAVGVIVLDNAAIAPSTSVDIVQLYAADAAVGHATLAIFSEETVAAIGEKTITQYYPVIINGVVKNIALVA
jgi:hypothetical protein